MDINPNYCSCGSKKSYSQEYDAYYCDSCNVWLEDKCNDLECEYCPGRPEQPVNESNT
jgi:hypothetical protein